MSEPIKKSRKGIGGPKTPEGKKKVSLNALRHGLCANTLVLSNESIEGFDHFRRMYLESFEPVGFLELELLDEMVAYKWRLRRGWTNETAAIDYEMDRQLDQERGTVEHLDEPTRTALARRKLNEAGELQNYSRYETRLHRMYHRALNKLLELQEKRRSTGQPVVTRGCQTRSPNRHRIYQTNSNRVWPPLRPTPPYSLLNPHFSLLSRHFSLLGPTTPASTPPGPSRAAFPPACSH
jgi:hypothetical protein